MTDVRVLGPVEVSTDQGPAPLRPREAAVVAALALVERPLVAADIVHLIWSDPPASAVGAVRNHVSHLRRTVNSLVSGGSGYRFEADVRVDARRLEAVAARAASGTLDGDAAAQAVALAAVRDSWRGEAFGELVVHPRVVATREHLADLRSVIDEELAAAMLDAQQTHAAHELLLELVQDAPRRSRRWSLLALASYRLGLRDSALAATTRANDFRTDADASDDEQLMRILRDDPILLTAGACPVTRRAVPIIAPPVDSRLRRYGFVGRVHELRWLQDAIDVGPTTEAGSGARLIGVEGEPGIGKTDLAYRAATDATGRGVLALWAWCDLTPVGSFAVLGRLVQDLVASLGAEVVAGLAGDDLASLVALAPDAAWNERHRGDTPASPPTSGDAGVRALLAASRLGPVVCVVDDVQWATTATLRALSDLAASDAPIVLVVVARRGQLPSSLDLPSARILPLGELEVDDVREYLRRALEFTPSDDLVELIWARAGGHPLLLREIVESIEPTATPDSVHELASGPELPRSVADAVTRRLDELRPSTLLAVRAASVLGRSFSPPLLADMVDLDDDALAEATAAGIVAPESRRGRARFRHELVRAVIYDGLAEPTRAQFHEAAGNALTNRNVPRWNEVAYHFVAAADLDPRRAVSACRRAGREALTSFHYDDAAEHFGRVVELLEEAGELDSPVLVDALVDRGYSMLRCGDPEMVGILTRAAVIARDTGDVDRLARAVTVLCDASPVNEAGVPDPEVAALVDLALEGAHEPDTVARLCASASYLFSVVGDWERCRSLYERAVATGVGSRAMAAVLPFAAIALGGPDDLGRRAAAADDLDLIAEQDGDPLARSEALHVRIGVQLQLGDPRFRESLDQMIEMENVVSEPASRWSIAYLTATREHIDGNLLAAEAAAAEGLGPRCRGIAESRLLAAYGAQLVALRVDEGRIAELVPMLEDLVTDQPDVAAWRAVLVAALAEGDPDRAGREFDCLAADGFAVLPRDFTWSAAMTTLTLGIARSGDGLRARTAHAALAPYAGRVSWSGSCTFGPVDQALGEAAAAFGDMLGAEAHFRRAAEVAQRLGAPRMFALARAGLDAALPDRRGDGIVD